VPAYALAATLLLLVASLGWNLYTARSGAERGPAVAGAQSSGPGFAENLTAVLQTPHVEDVIRTVTAPYSRAATQIPVIAIIFGGALPTRDVPAQPVTTTRNDL
jgi:hypothetical protein